MQDVAPVLIALGGLFLAGLAADSIGRRTRLPRVTLLLGCGLLGGASGFDLIPQALAELYPVMSVIALCSVSFLLGSSLSLRALYRHGKAILIISLTIVVVTLAMVSLGLWALGLPLAVALVFGAIATATDPAATLDVITQSKQRTRFTDTLKGIVAIDDAWGLLVFSLVIVVAQSLSGAGNGAELFQDAITEVGLSVALGIAIGLPGALLTGRLSEGEPLRIEALGLIFVTAGLSLLLDLSYLITGMTVGAIIVNVARHHTRAFHEIEHIQWPFMVIFFILAGASLDLSSLWALGGVGIGYLLLRTAGRMVGGWSGSVLAGSPKNERKWFGPALLPQAGVAIGMALIAAEYLPDHGDMIIALTIGTTVVFELIGPLIAAAAIQRVAQTSSRSQDKA
ncbi:cation:proton antiporter [Phaeobacter marinintestinus]|uniref:cation:proton antiporter n=1 Tax=Falsiphaeobacter marinintestinus TaxID=1492905 RepID=UPI0011B48AF3|nr:cation:proton antiporter [Phaeobacter marinintestinus]